jgi:hypothetical protein
VSIKFRDVEIVRDEPGEVIIDLNGRGNWIRGIEAIGGMPGISLRCGMLPFLNKRSVGLVATYDGEADAAYFRLQYGARFNAMSPRQREALTAYSHPINPTGIYSLDAEGGIASIMFSVSDAVENIQGFLMFFDYEVQQTVLVSSRVSGKWG